MYKISEIAKELNVSKTSVYKKIDKLKPSFNKHIKTHKGVKHLTAEGLAILKKAFGVETLVETVEISGLNEITQLLVLEKDKQIEHLKQQLKQKDIQLEKKEDSLAKALEVADKTQHLLAMEKQLVLQLQEPPEKKGFWDRFKSDKGGE